MTTSSPDIAVRKLERGDIAVARQITADAFRRPEAPEDEPVEVPLYDRLRREGDVIGDLTLVAVIAETGVVVGAAICSKAVVGDVAVAALGPIGVDPPHQGRGIGSALVEELIRRTSESGWPLIGLLGSTEWYSRFGFVPASKAGIEAPDPAWGDHFQVHLLAGEQHPTGAFRYAAAFNDLS